MQISSPCDRCDAATCPQANAASASQPNRRHPPAEKNPDAPTSASGVHARVPANGIEMATIEAAIAIAIDRPPAVAAGRPSPSLRRNHQSPRPARMGFSTISARRPSPHPNIHEKAIVGSDSHPDCASAANGVPAISNGFHSGTRAWESASPSRHERGSQNVRMSGCWFVSLGRNAKPRSAISTETTISAGPAAATRTRRLRDVRSCCRSAAGGVGAALVAVSIGAPGYPVELRSECEGGLLDSAAATPSTFPGTRR